MRAKGESLPLIKILRALRIGEGVNHLSPLMRGAETHVRDTAFSSAQRQKSEFGVIAIVSDYEYYRDTYLGTLLTEENFPKYALRADSFLDLLTTGRYENDCLPAGAVEAVKMAECAIAELCLNLEQAELQSDAAWRVQGEKVGNHTVTFRNSAEIIEQTKKQIRKIAVRYLGRHGLLYKGVSICMHRI